MSVSTSVGASIELTPEWGRAGVAGTLESVAPLSDADG